MVDVFGQLFSMDSLAQEDVLTVIKQLTSTCGDCRLSLLHPNNRGFLCRGNPNAKIGVLAEAPGDRETELGQPLIGNSGKEWDKWAASIGINTKTMVFHSNVVQCQPPKEKKEGDQRASQIPPDKDEIKACFIPRSLRVFKAMPNLECIITLGWVAAKAILGGEPGSKTHEGKWFESTALPGKAVFCMVHPSFVLRDPSPEKNARVEEALRAFKREYLDSDKCLKLAKEVKEKRDAAVLQY